ncbi:MAG: pilus assembly protein N-terminal domain-containing protein [Pseudomonadota bacterium]
MYVTRALAVPGRLLSIALLSALPAAPVLAGGPGAGDAPHPLCAGAEQGEECMVVIIDHLKQVRIDEPVKTLLIGNPAIADVNLIGETHAVITARAVGSTNIFFLDGDNEPIAQYRVYVREGDARRVMLRRGPDQLAQYQCSPRCERTLSQSDSAKQFAEQTSKMQGAASLATDAAKSASK